MLEVKCNTSFLFQICLYSFLYQVCSDVTSLYADVLLYTECEMKMYNQTVSSSHWVYKFVPIYECVKSYENIVHKKTEPVCTEKPKQVCNSKWKTLPSGKKVSILKLSCIMKAF